MESTPHPPTLMADMTDTFLGVATPNPERFLATIDRIGDRLSLNVPPVFQITDLAKLPIGSLGRALADHFTHNGFEPLTTGPRRKQLHDVVHVLTGFGTDPVGELEVQAFMLGAKFFPTHLVLGIALFHLADRQHHHLGVSRREMLHRMRQAYDRGSRSTLDIDTWQPEYQWHLPLLEVQARLNLLG
jgi:ubiquinone biosynthesis protein COQ4